MTSVFERLLNMSITGSIVIAVVLLARLCLKRAGAFGRLRVDGLLPAPPAGGSV